MYLMRKNNKPFTEYSLMKMMMQYSIILKTMSIFGDLINVEGNQENIKKFMKSFSLKQVNISDYDMDKAYKRQFNL